MSSTTTQDRLEHATLRWSLNAALAGLPLALIAVGPAIVVSISGRTLPVYASQIAIAVLVIHIGFSVLAQRSYGDVPATMRWLLAGTALLAVALIWSTDPAAGMLAYLNFGSGTVGGMVIAQVWKGMSRGFSWIDVSYAVFLIAGIAQLLASFSKASSVNSLHQSSQTPWGNSNFVAGCLVVAALVVVVRSASLGRHRKYAVTLALVAIGVALLTLSRGAIVAACVGAIFFLWSKSGTRRPRGHRPSSTASRRVNTNVVLRLLARMLAVLVPVVAFMAVDHVTGLRAQVSKQVFSNVDGRFELFRLAWENFLQNPLTGTGWASFRDSSMSIAGQSQTFAHNLILSMLQIGGLLSVPYLAALSYLAYRALRYGGPYTAAVAAAIAVSMTQPFFESTVGNLIALPIAFLAGFTTAMASENDIGVMTTPRPNSARTHIQSPPRMQPERAL